MGDSAVRALAMTKDDIIRVVTEQRRFFNSGATRDYSVRHEALCKLKGAMKDFEAEIHMALKADLAKPEFEAYFTETGFCQHELTETIRKLRKWMKPKRVRTGWLVQPARSEIHYSPRGVNLIISPYNYPINLTFSPCCFDDQKFRTGKFKNMGTRPPIQGEEAHDRIHASELAYSEAMKALNPYS